MQRFSLPLPPDWVVEETQRRVLLLINHILQQEPEATRRLARQQGNVILAQWRQFTFKLLVTPAGLFDLAPAPANADLTLEMTEPSVWALARLALQRQKPPVRIAGDVQLAAEVNWLADHVRWDIEEDLSRLLGDVPAHGVVQAARNAGKALAQFVAQANASPSRHRAGSGA